MKKSKIYVITMYKYGERNSHSYVYGVFDKKHKAIEAAEKETDGRGGKYSPEIIEFDINTKFEEHFNDYTGKLDGRNVKLIREIDK